MESGLQKTTPGDAAAYPASPSLSDHLRRGYNLLVDSRYTVWVLLALGLLRVVLFTLAYPPAHGADSDDYFLYAAQFEGLDAPTVFQLIYPLYPLGIYLSHHVLGSVYWLIGVQLLMSLVQGAVMYWGIRRYSPGLAFAVALFVLGNPQTGILYNFTSTEPLYMFLLNLAFAVFLVQVSKPSDRRLQAGDVLLGVVLVGILLARPVGRYLIVPFGILFFLGTLSFWRSAVVAISYGAMIVVSMLFNQLVFDSLELTGGGTFMLNRPLLRSGLLDADNGPASARVIALREQCPEGQSKNTCLIEVMGDYPSVRRLYQEAYEEMLQTRGREFAELVFEAFTDFLRKPGLQYRGEVAPSDVQCEDIAERADRNTRAYIEKDWILTSALDASYDRLYPILYDTSDAMCPPWPDSDVIREWVDRLAVRYRSFSRPRPYLWYGLLGVLVIVVPKARRFLLMTLLAGGILANHALASALVLNVQPRYIAVTYSFRIVLLLTLFAVLIEIAITLAQRWQARRPSSSPPAA